MKTPQPIDQRITPDHRERMAIIYVRQSDPQQVRNNTESTRLQLGLRQKAVGMGWLDPIAIEDDLGVSAAGYADRPGFQRMLTDVAVRKVGIILCVDASRLSRNSKDWAHLFELCGHFDTLIADLEQVYDLSVPNDRLVLGIKGTVAELELSILRSRLRAAQEQKAARGELKFLVPPGYAHDHAGLIVLDPDRRVREAIAAMFDRFDQCTSVRQLAMWYRDTATVFPIRKVRKSRTIAWEVPTISTLRKLIEHPIYAGSYVYGRRTVRVELVDGALVKRVGGKLPLDQCLVHRRDNHRAYISWERFEANQAKIAENRPRWNMDDNRGAIRDGLALLAGMLRCGHCGRKLYVTYKTASALYYCDGGQTKGSKRCLSFGSKRIDEAVGHELCRALDPVAIKASELAYERARQDHRRTIEEARLRVEAAQYEADRAFEQYDLVDPKNRLVADTLEQRLNERLAELQDARRQHDAALDADEPLTDEQRDLLRQLGHDFPRAWNHPDAPVELRKRLLRGAIHEVIVKHLVERKQIEATIHWQGGAHTRIQVEKRGTPIGSKADTSLVETVTKLAESLDDAEIARILNMQKTTTPRGLPWTQDRAREFRRSHHIRLKDRTPNPDLMTGQQAAEYLGISRNGLLGLIRIGVVHKNQVTDFAPWRISRVRLDSEAVQRLVRTLKSTGRLPAQGGCLEDQVPLLPMKSSKEE